MLEDEPQYERDLEEWVQTYVSGLFIKHPLTPFRGADYVVANTSIGGRSVGAWTQPDLTLVSINNLSLQRQLELEIFSFELKRKEAKDANIKAVLEAVAHTRFAHYAYVVWHVLDEHKVTELERACQTYGIGLIVFYDMTRTVDYRLVLAPIRNNPHPVDVESFLVDRLPPDRYVDLQKRVDKLHNGGKFS